ncbi:SRPBCC domain-containing protein [Alloacidobacterium sp.]|uniref:SRPBCC domain-containing protein n=1 Tax=Alloacidobacterium sp. TaxID=2951999 RepID=UPI002D5C7423|nr:SRPBCC domain-containing protein [Alloacidobacterium sp.]HYK38370.1 SRPBCC domain-containing protein [Alloacidobacterium sp.]
MTELFIRKSIEVNATAEALWKVLTDNTLIPQYMFGCVAETDWKPGSPLLWKGAADGKLYVKGHVVTADAPRRLEYTCIDPNNPAVPDIPANYLTMIYEIRKQGEGLVLEIIQGDYSKVVEGQKRYEDTLKGDDYILVKIKELAEGLSVATAS